MRQNSFNFLRVFFASLVIVAHSVEIVDGSRDREPLTWLFSGPVSSGQLAVIGFFLVSGYLITASWQSTPDLRAYFTKRILRIYPAFLVCFAVCVFIVVPFSGAPPISGIQWLKLAIQAVVLWRPIVPGVFPDVHYATLNGSAWTIGYEFRCYILVALFGATGLLGKRKWIAGITAVSLVGAVLAGAGIDLVAYLRLPSIARLLIDPENHAAGWLFPAFLVGVTFRLYRDDIKLNAMGAIAAALLLCLSLAIPVLSFAGAAVFGGYLTFYVALAVKSPLLWSIGQKNDISYGLYLYAWPIGMLLVYYIPGIGPIELGLLTFAGSVALGWLSWLAIERPAMSRKPHPAPAST